METLQTWITTWLDPSVVGAAVMDWGGRILDKYGLSIPAAHRAVPAAQLIASK